MVKTGFEKFAEKNSAMSELNIKIGKSVGQGKAEEKGRGEAVPAGSRKKNQVKKLLKIPADLFDRLEEIKRETYKTTLTSVIYEALSEYVVNYDKRKSEK